MIAHILTFKGGCSLGNMPKLMAKPYGSSRTFSAGDVFDTAMVWRVEEVTDVYIGPPVPRSATLGATGSAGAVHWVPKAVLAWQLDLDLVRWRFKHAHKEIVEAIDVQITKLFPKKESLKPRAPSCTPHVIRNFQPNTSISQ